MIDCSKASEELLVVLEDGEEALRGEICELEEQEEEEEGRTERRRFGRRRVGTESNQFSFTVAFLWESRRERGRRRIKIVQSYPNCS